MPEGGKLTIETANASLDETYVEAHGRAVPPGQYVLVAVTDTGTGMDPATMAGLRAVLHHQGSRQGTGLGLSQVYGFVRQSNGHVKDLQRAGRRDDDQDLPAPPDRL